MDRLLLDIRYAIRTLYRSPVFTLAALLCLALGIGANTAIFSVVNGVMLQPLPFDQPDRVVVVHEVAYDGSYSAFAPADYLDLRDRSRTLEVVAAHRGMNANIMGPDGPERLRARAVSPNFFRVFGVEPALGRGFASEGDADAATGRGLVLSYRAWSSRFGGDPTVLGSTMSVNGQPYTVLGVMPASFRYPEDAELWIGAQRQGIPEPPIDVGEDLSTLRSLGYLGLVARLAPGATLAQAGSEVDVLARQMAEEAGEDANTTADIVPIHEELIGDVRSALLVLLGAVGFVLLIACANVANLLLARATGREREVAVRAALGAGRGRLLAQLLTESVLLSTVGGVVGLLVALWGVDLLPRVAPEGIPRLAEIGLDANVLAFALAVTLLTGIVFGLLPALQASRPDLHSSLKEGGRSGTAGRERRRFRGLLVASEVALSLVLLTGAGLLIRSMVRLQSAELGFRPERVLTMRVNLPESRYPDDAEQGRFARELTERVQGLPGVRSAAVVLALPFSGTAATLAYEVEGIAPPPGDYFNAEYQVVSPDYFQTLGIPLLRGRTFTGADDSDAPAVAMVNETFARKHWPGGDAIGRRVTFGNEDEYMEILGVVGNVRHFAYDQAPRPEVYVPFAQDPWPFMSLVVRAEREPLALTAAAQRQVLELDPEQPVYEVATLDEVLAATVGQRRFTLGLLGLFAGLAVVLALVGIYGVMSYTVSQRVTEYGIRMALGAPRSDVLRLTMGSAMKLVLLGVGVGLLAALALGRFISSLLYQVSAADPLVLGAVTGVVVLASALAAYLPARRASRVDPMLALRGEA